MIACGTCQAPVETPRRGQRFCSVRCKRAAAHERRREREGIERQREIVFSAVRGDWRYTVERHRADLLTLSAESTSMGVTRPLGVFSDEGRAAEKMREWVDLGPRGAGPLYDWMRTKGGAA